MCINCVLAGYPTRVELGSYPHNNQEHSPHHLCGHTKEDGNSRPRPGVEKGRGTLSTLTLGPSMALCQGQEHVVSEGSGAKDDTALQSQSTRKGVPKAKGLESAKEGDRNLEGSYPSVGLNNIKEAWASNKKQQGREARKSGVSTSVIPAPRRLRPKGREFVASLDRMFQKQELTMGPKRWLIG